MDYIFYAHAPPPDPAASSRLLLLHSIFFFYSVFAKKGKESAEGLGRREKHIPIAGPPQARNIHTLMSITAPLDQACDSIAK